MCMCYIGRCAPRRTQMDVKKKKILPHLGFRFDQCFPSSSRHRGFHCTRTRRQRHRNYRHSRRKPQRLSGGSCTGQITTAFYERGTRLREVSQLCPSSLLGLRWNQETHFQSQLEAKLFVQKDICHMYPRTSKDEVHAWVHWKFSS
jgi:hypothetical protein